MLRAEWVAHGAHVTTHGVQQHVGRRPSACGLELALPGPRVGWHFGELIPAAVGPRPREMDVEESPAGRLVRRERGLSSRKLPAGLGIHL